MSMRDRISKRLTAIGACSILAALGIGLVSVGPAHAGASTADAPVHQIRIARQRPPCSSLPAMPIVPNDPGALVTGGGIRCYGTRAPQLELWLPEDRYLWLERSTPNPAAWIDLGPVVVDPATLEAPPLGLLLSKAEGAWTLETRHGQIATLTRLEPGSWQEITSPDGQRFWVQLDRDELKQGRELTQGRVRRAD